MYLLDLLIGCTRKMMDGCHCSQYYYLATQFLPPLYLKCSHCTFSAPGSQVKKKGPLFCRVCYSRLICYNLSFIPLPSLFSKGLLKLWQLQKTHVAILMKPVLNLKKKKSRQWSNYHPSSFITPLTWEFSSFS